MTKRELTERQKKFLEVLFEEANGDVVQAKLLAGYSEHSATSSIVASMKDEIMEAIRSGKFIYDVKGPTVYENKNNAYLKIGIYRNAVNRLWSTGRDGGTTVVYYDNINTGETMESVLGKLNYPIELEYKKSEKELLQEELAILKIKIKENNDPEISRKIHKLKRKLKRLELN